MMKSIYRSEEGKKRILELYDAQLSRLTLPYRDIYVDTSFGKTHLIETGNFDKEPLLVFHGGNATTAYNLLTCDFLFEDFHIYAVDIIGHPGKSAERSLPASGYDYGLWAGEVIEALGFEKIRLFGGSFGGGIIAKTMCVVPDKVERAVLYIPAGISNAPAIRTDDICQTAKLSINYVKVKTAMPSNVDADKMKKCLASALVMGAEKDCLFPGPGVIRRAKRIIPNCKTCLLRGRGHMHFLTDEEKKMIVVFLKKK